MPPYHWWRTVFFLIPAIGVYTIVLGTISLLSSLFDSSGDFGHRCARAWAWLILKTTGVRVDVRGLEHIPEHGPALIVSNHVSFMDALVIGGSVRRPVRFVMDHNIFRIPVMGFIFRTARAIPIAPAREAAMPTAWMSRSSASPR